MVKFKSTPFLRIMRIKNILITLFLIHFSVITYSQILSDEERKLYKLLMEYREENGLPNIPLSASLTSVAQTHVKDLLLKNHI